MTSETQNFISETLRQGKRFKNYQRVRGAAVYRYESNYYSKLRWREKYSRLCKMAGAVEKF